MRYYIVTGESSGDMHAANLVKELRKYDHEATVRAWGGDRLINEDVAIAKHIKDTSFMGIWSVLKNINVIKSNLKFCKSDIMHFSPDAVVLVDYPGFNLKIAEFAKSNGIKVFYYISPKVWAWNKNRISKIKKFIDHLIVIFPFEVDFFKKFGIEVSYVGNPIFDEINKKRYKLSAYSKKPIISLLPGSRKQEIETILPQMLKVIDRFPNYQFIIAGTNLFTPDYYNNMIGNKNVIVVYNETYALLDQSTAALVTSGTASLETALFKVPQVVCYKTNWITYFIAKSLIKIKFISLVNILLKKSVVKELIQSKLNNENLEKELDLILNDNLKIKEEYINLSKLLSKKDASNNAARIIFDLI